MADPKPHALIDADGLIQNVILWDGEADYPLPDGWKLELHDPAAHAAWATDPSALAQPDSVSKKPASRKAR